MSLNHKEIDLVLSELDLVGAHIERVLQPSYDSIVLGLFKSGKVTNLLLSIAHGACRVHAQSSASPKPERPLRFQECLRSRIKGGRLLSAVQLGAERILRLEIEVFRSEIQADGASVYKAIGAGARARGGATKAAAEAEYLRYRLYVRLWSGAGNIILVDEEGIIVDALARRPKKGELSGEVSTIEEGLSEAKPPSKEFAVRDFPALEDRPEGGSFNERVEAAYAAHGGELSRDKLLELARDRFEKRSTSLNARINELENRVTEFRDGDRFREIGDILMANQGIKVEGRFLNCDDFYRNAPIAIQIDPTKSVLENAQAYYERYRKASSGLTEVESELEATMASLEAEKAEFARLEAIQEPLLLARALAKGGTARTAQNQKRAYPGLSLERDGWTILVGRSAKENDELLRRHVRGSDLWMHARDYAGSYVFVKAKPGKSFPLEILLDAGNLAIYYSKGRSNGGGELYYTMAKYLRRAKDGPKGLVLPSHEKNLHVKLDEKRLGELKNLIGEE